jgi:hypothetical protein
VSAGCPDCTADIPNVIRKSDAGTTAPGPSRKEVPLGSGCFDYFPDALWEVAHLSWVGNEKHNPGEELHDARSKSADDVDCLLRHLKDRGKWDEIVTKDGRVLHVRHSAAVAWRALRILQKECEAEGAPMAPGARP